MFPCQGQEPPLISKWPRVLQIMPPGGNKNKTNNNGY